MKKFYKNEFQKIHIILLACILMLPSLLQAQTDKILLTNYQACGGVTLVPSVRYATNGAPITIYYERLSGADVWQIEATQVYNYRSSYIQYNGDDILQPTLFRVRSLDGITGNIYISNSVSVDPTKWNVDRGTAWSTAYATWGSNCNNSNFINIESNIIATGRPPFTMQYKKQGDANYTGAGETTGNGLIPNIEFGINYDVRITDKCGKISNLTTRLYLDCKAGDLVLPSGCQNADGSITVYPSNDNRYAGIPPYTYNVRKPGTATDDTAFVNSNVFNKLSAGTYYYSIRDACGHTSFGTSIVLGSPTPVCYADFYNDKTDSCYMDIAIVPVKGTGPFTYGLSYNHGPYSYSQDSIFKVFADGAYFYTITDNCGTVSEENRVSIYHNRPFIDSVTTIGNGCIKDYVIHAARGLKPFVYTVTGVNPSFVINQASDTFRNLGPNIYRFNAIDRCGKPGVDKIIFDTVNCNLRTSPGDFESNNSNIGCANISGSKWIDISDENGNLIYSINPNGNVMNNVCWGIHVENNSGQAPRSGNINNTPSYFLDRNFYIEPPANIILKDSVSIRIYITNDELTNLLDYLGNIGIYYGVDELKILKKKGSPGSPADLSVTNDSLAGNSQFTIITPLVVPFGPDATYFEFKVKDFSEFNPFAGELSTLPLRMISFSATKQIDKIELNWEVSKESGAKSFDVEWSIDGSHFKNLGNVPADNISIHSTYSFVHNYPESGVNFYRLKQVDKDGKYFYSKIISVDMDNEHSIVIAPNPVHDNLTIKLPVNNHFTSIKVYDMKGRMMLMQMLPGYSTGASINVKTLANGVYILELDGNNKKRMKFIKF